jgi:mevalonate kinase
MRWGPDVQLASAASSTGFGHGKVILLGEHAVVHGHRAVAAGLSAGLRAEVRPGPGRIRIPAWDLETALGDGSPVSRAVERLLARLDTGPVDLAVDAQIPAGAGLGSSAAMAVSVAQAVSRGRGLPETELLAAVAESERVFHANPSGLDAAAALRGGVGRFQREEGWQPVRLARPLELCVGLTGQTHDTREQVGAVAALCACDPRARRLIDDLGEVSELGLDAIGRGDSPLLGGLFDVAHGLLAELGLSTAALDALVGSARAAGALGAKLTGAGGGGAVIALAPGRSDEVLAAWRRLGFSAFTTVVGHV